MLPDLKIKFSKDTSTSLCLQTPRASVSEHAECDSTARTCGLGHPGPAGSALRLLLKPLQSYGSPGGEQRRSAHFPDVDGEAQSIR